MPLRIHPPNLDRVVDRRGIHEDWEPVRFRTDGRGYVLPGGADPAAWTVAFLGGSTTECLAVPETARFPASVGARLAARGLPTRTLNAGRSGNTAHDSLNLLVSHLVLDDPDVVVVMHAVNDAGLLRGDPRYRTRSSRPAGSAYLLPALLRETSRFLATSSFVRERLGARRRGAGFEPALAGDPPSPEPFAARLRALAESARALGLRPVFATRPATPGRTPLTPSWFDPAAQDLMNQTVRDVARERGVTLVDLAALVPERAPGADRALAVFYDGIHVTESGSELYAELLAEALWTLRPGADPGGAAP